MSQSFHSLFRPAAMFHIYSSSAPSVRSKLLLIDPFVRSRMRGDGRGGRKAAACVRSSKSKVASGREILTRDRTQQWHCGTSATTDDYKKESMPISVLVFLVFLAFQSLFTIS